MMRELNFLCSACGLAVEDDEGYIHVPGLWKRIKERDAWDLAHAPEEGKLRAFTMDVLMTKPAQARWVVHHEACDPNPDGSEYWFEVSRCRTYRELLDWTAQLMEKTWIDHTNWSQFIRALAHAPTASSN